MQAIRRSDFGTFIATTGIAFGVVLRLLPPIMAGSPINDGGLFYQMVGDLIANHLRIPPTTSYNNLGIPFVYPPLALYVAAIVRLVTGLDLYRVIQYLPGLLAALTVPGVWWLASIILGDRLRGAVAAFFYATIPASFVYLSMGGGLTRAPGMAFSILALSLLYRLFTTADRRYLFAGSVAIALVVLVHPEAAFHTMLTAAFFWLFFGRNRQSLANGAWSLVIAAGLSSAWWLPALRQHGMEPFLNALAGQPFDPAAWMYLLRLDLTGDALLPFAGVFAAIGLMAALIRRDWFLPAWLLLTFVTSPRSAPYGVEVPLALLAAVGLETVIGASSAPLERLYASRAHSFAFLAMMLYCFASGLITGLRTGYEFRILPPERDAFQWIAQNLDPAARVAVITGAPLPSSDPVSEWFPALAGRTSVATIQGHEWTPESSLRSTWASHSELQRCLDSDVDCVERWDARRHIEFTHIYMRRSRLNADGSYRPIGSVLELSLRNSRGYEVIFESPAAIIFARISQNTVP